MKPLYLAAFVAANLGVSALLCGGGVYYAKQKFTAETQQQLRQDAAAAGVGRFVADPVDGSVRYEWLPPPKPTPLKFRPVGDAK